MEERHQAAFLGILMGLLPVVSVDIWDLLPAAALLQSQQASHLDRLLPARSQVHPLFLLQLQLRWRVGTLTMGNDGQYAILSLLF